MYVDGLQGCRVWLRPDLDLIDWCQQAQFLSVNHTLVSNLKCAVKLCCIISEGL